MIYLDNAATTNRKPREVYKALRRFYNNAQANPTRSNHTLSARASELLYDAREEIAGLFSLDTPERVVFTYNATYALNIAIKSAIEKGAHVITSDLEHNSVIRVLDGLSGKMGVEYSRFDSSRLSEEELSRHLKSNTTLVVSTLASNVSGKVIDENILSVFARKHNLKLILDGAQAAGHRAIDLKKTPAYAFCAPGHKALFGLMGSGFAIFSDTVRGESLIEGGSGSNSRDKEMPRLLPEGYEAGTPGMPAIVGLCEGVKFIRSYGLEAVEEKLDYLTKRLYEGLAEDRRIKVHGYGSGILSFNLSGVPSTLLSEELSNEGICTRGGLHCSPEAHRTLGTEESGAVRASFSLFNEKRDVDRLLLSLKRIEKRL